MPDIQSAMANILSAWASDDAATPVTPVTLTPRPQSFPPVMTNQTTPTEVLGTSRATFNYIKDNPYLTTAQAVRNLEQRGYKPASTTSLISQMYRQGLVSRDKDGKLTAIAKEYRPIKNNVAAKRRTVIDVRAIKSRPVAAGIASLSTPNAQVTQAGPKTLVQRVDESLIPVAAAPTVLTAKHLMETLSIKEARALYLELKEIFGA